MSKPKVSIVIVYYKNLSDLKTCVASIKKSKTNTSFEIIVVNNSKIKIKILGVRVITKNKNLGYGAGNNFGVEESLGEYILILNPDTKVYPDSIDILTKFLDKNKDVAIAAPILLNQNEKVLFQLGYGKLTPLAYIFSSTFVSKIFSNNQLVEGYWQKDKILQATKLDKNIKVDMVAGSALMIRKKHLHKIGGYDEHIFLYFEEADLGLRLNKFGYKSYLVPTAKVIHKWKRKVHEYLEVKGSCKTLKNSIEHYPHQTIKEFIAHINSWSSLHALANKREGKRAYFVKIILWPTAHFFRNYIVRFGFLDGLPGLVFALLMSMHSFLSWGKLWSMERK